ncbi:MAG: hypothetical protein ACYCTY_07285 [Sulfuricella sp.]
MCGDCRAAALCHVARTVCRRTECACVKLNHAETLSPFLRNISTACPTCCSCLPASSANSMVDPPDPKAATGLKSGCDGAGSMPGGKLTRSISLPSPLR